LWITTLADWTLSLSSDWLKIFREHIQSIYNFASGQVGCVKLVQGVVFRNARKHSKVQIGTAGQHSASQLIAVTLNIHLILYALVSWLAAGVPSKTDWSAL